MSPHLARALRSAIAAALLLATASCIWIFHKVDVKPVAAATLTQVSTPVKAHLASGETVVYRDGVLVGRDSLRGRGMRYNLQLTESTAVHTLSFDSVVAMESFETSVNEGKSVAVSMLTTIVVPVAIVGIYCATNPKCFGSCPTFYSDTGAGLALEAEGFSYSIAPLFEAQDIDRLRAQADPAGNVTLEVRNEALETHYINHLALLEIRRGRDELVVPDDQGRPLALRDMERPASATTRSGRAVLDAIAGADGVSFRTDSATLAAVTAGDAADWIDLTAPAPRGRDSVAVVFRMRNSLLNTVLLYDLMLGQRGAHSLDWMGQDLEQVGPALELGHWYATKMGMDIAVWDGARYRTVAHVGDTGPVAWKDVAAIVPVLTADTVRIRVRFPADNWRIDRIAFATGVRHPTAIPHALTQVIDASGKSDSAALANMAGADRRYLMTTPGQRMTAVFAVGAAADSARTFFLVSQGYYIEWVRHAWLASGTDSTRFVPSDSALFQALTQWRNTQKDLELRFAATRVPVR